MIVVFSDVTVNYNEKKATGGSIVQELDGYNNVISEHVEITDIPFSNDITKMELDEIHNAISFCKRQYSVLPNTLYCDNYASVEHARMFYENAIAIRWMKRKNEGIKKVHNLLKRTVREKAKG